MSVWVMASETKKDLGEMSQPVQERVSRGPLDMGSHNRNSKDGIEQTLPPLSMEVVELLTRLDLISRSLQSYDSRESPALLQKYHLGFQTTPCILTEEVKYWMIDETHERVFVRSTGISPFSVSKFEESNQTPVLNL